MGKFYRVKEILWNGDNLYDVFDGKKHNQKHNQISDHKRYHYGCPGIRVITNKQWSHLDSLQGKGPDQNSSSTVPGNSQ